MFDKIWEIFKLYIIDLIDVMILRYFEL